MQPQALLDDLSLVPADERRFDAQCAARAFFYRPVHRIHEFLAAIGVGVSGCIIMMCAVVDDTASLGKCDARRCRKEQSVTERDIGRDRCAVRTLQLLCIAFLGDLFGRVGKQRAVAVREHRGKVEGSALHTVVFEDLFRSLDLPDMFLTIINGQRADVFSTVFLDSERKTGRAVYAARAEHHSFFAHRLSTFSG